MMDRSHECVEEAGELMTRFRQRTAIDSPGPARRYLWTDAFAVCNFLGLARATGDERFTQLALTLVDRVHHTLGRHRADSSRKGWLSGLDEVAGQAHPTLGGLRIGKVLPERGPDEPFNEALEWQRDGQYFHYLTKWMHALDLVSRATAEPRFNGWARELLQVAHRAFSYRPEVGGRPRMFWKMSVDLARPLVSSMGQHDPLDGFITALELSATQAMLPGAPAEPNLQQATAGFVAMLEPSHWTTPDALGIGGLLMDAWRVAELLEHGLLEDDELLRALLKAAFYGLRYYAEQDDRERGAPERLAFRELGLSIGLHAIELLEQQLRTEPQRFTPDLQSLLHAFAPYLELGSAIESFWREPRNQQAGAWSEHLDINEVMLATNLVPEGCLGWPSPSRSRELGATSDQQRTANPA